MWACVCVFVFVSGRARMCLYISCAIKITFTHRYIIIFYVSKIQCFIHIDCHFMCSIYFCVTRTHILMIIMDFSKSKIKLKKLCADDDRTSQYRLFRLQKYFTYKFCWQIYYHIFQLLNCRFCGLNFNKYFAIKQIAGKNNLEMSKRY